MNNKGKKLEKTDTGRVITHTPLTLGAIRGKSELMLDDPNEQGWREAQMSPEPTRAELEVNAEGQGVSSECASAWRKKT